MTNSIKICWKSFDFFLSFNWITFNILWDWMKSVYKSIPETSRQFKLNLFFICFMFLYIFQECSVFLFEKRCAEKLHKPKRKETVTEILRASVKQLERFRHPKVNWKTFWLRMYITNKMNNILKYKTHIC